MTDSRLIVDRTALETEPGQGYFASWWLDDDGTHVWVQHVCNGETVTTMLPWPTWQVVDGEVEPSFQCDACGTHQFLLRVDSTAPVLREFVVLGDAQLLVPCPRRCWKQMNGLRLYRTALHEDALCDCDDGRVAATVGSTVPDVDVYGVVSNITDIDGNPAAVLVARVRTVHVKANEEDGTPLYVLDGVTAL